MKTHLPDLRIRAADVADREALDAVRAAAFAPVFASFRNLLGPELYALAQEKDDQAHGELLAGLMAPDSGWEVYAAECSGQVVGFVSVRLDSGRAMGEIGLNAVAPDHTGRGIGTAMYEFALARMREAGMRVATVGTGGDVSHEPARHAYRKAGFNAQVPSVWMCCRL
ncbi:GNAT family N-acetyltransferase [Arenimonas daejeonensis]|uniref:GNAT family N-acetyltransferase n=1 Tax=Arenimonas daejeonensis TaxID=370777 RepID=UPI0011BD64C6|nr:GNAT family N-acetyltransferase [Arenimonas daejeonensis]